MTTQLPLPDGKAPISGTPSAQGGGAPSLKIAITGRFRTGKDTVADILVDLLDGPKSDKMLRGEVVRLAFADALKQELSDMVMNFTALSDMVMNFTARPEFFRGQAADGIPGTFVVRDGYKIHDAQMREDRAINGSGWQWWGEYRRQKFGQDYWVQHPRLQYRYSEAVLHRKHIIITDMRHHNEAQWCRERGFYLVRVEGPCRADEHRDPNHPSEVHIPELKVDWNLYNTGNMGDLRNIVEQVVLPRALEHAIGNQ